MSEHGAVDLASPPSSKLPDAAALPEVPYALFASSDPKQLEKAEDLQRLLNMFPGISLKNRRRCWATNIRRVQNREGKIPSRRPTRRISTRKAPPPDFPK